MNNLPINLMTELSLVMYENRYQNIKYFKDKDAKFVIWICPLLKPEVFDRDQYIYREEELITGIYFLIGGNVKLVLQKYNDSPFINVNEGYLFGMLDIIGSASSQEIDFKDWYAKRA